VRIHKLLSKGIILSMVADWFMYPLSFCVGQASVMLYIRQAFESTREMI